MLVGLLSNFPKGYVVLSSRDRITPDSSRAGGPEHALKATHISYRVVLGGMGGSKLR